MFDWNLLLNEDRLRPSTAVKDASVSSHSDPRNQFESDLGRISFSPALRRMHDKTQVFPLTTNDNIHSRLTHSVEVSTIGYSLGLRLLEEKDFLEKSGLEREDVLRKINTILKNTCLVHDIGNPPFGHFGETSIQAFFKDFFKVNQYNLKLSSKEEEDFKLFDGNAQGLRVLTKLQILDDAYGLNLTKSTLASYIKYPNYGKLDENKIHLKKRGVFQSEKKYFKEIAKDCGLEIEGEVRRHPLVYLMEAADSICYYVMDIEDGYNKEWYDYDFLKNKLKNIDSLKEYFEKVKGKGYSETKSIVYLRIEIIAIFVELAINNFMENYDEIMTGKYSKELIEDDPCELAENLNDFCRKYVFSNREIEMLELTGDSVLRGLLEKYIGYLFGEEKGYRQRAINLISGSIIKAAFIENGIDSNDGKHDKLIKYFDELSDYYKLRIIIDFISGMTDQYALSHYQKLSGQKII